MGNYLITQLCSSVLFCLGANIEMFLSDMNCIIERKQGCIGVFYETNGIIDIPVRNLCAVLFSLRFGLLFHSLSELDLPVLFTFVQSLSPFWRFYYPIQGKST